MSGDVAVKINIIVYPGYQLFLEHYLGNVYWTKPIGLVYNQGIPDTKGAI